MGILKSLPKAIAIIMIPQKKVDRTTPLPNRREQ